VDVHPDLTIPEALSSLRAQLLEAIEQASDEKLQLTCQKINLELQLTVTSVRKGDARATLWGVLAVGGGADHTNGTVHKITLELTPELPGRTGVKLADH
jgi:hypothetical protein